MIVMGREVIGKESNDPNKIVDKRIDFQYII